MMSSTRSTWRPSIAWFKSLRMRTTPEEWVPPPYEETDMKSTSRWVFIERTRSAM